MDFNTHWFDEYPIFYRRKETTHRAWLYNPDRMCFRHIGIIQRNKDLFQGKRVLDLASHDGRWSFAAIKAGAKEVVGVEARPQLIEAANETMIDLGVKSQIEFHQGDAHKVHEMDLDRFDKARHADGEAGKRDTMGVGVLSASGRILVASCPAGCGSFSPSRLADSAMT